MFGNILVVKVSYLFEVRVKEWVGYFYDSEKVKL